MPTGNCDTSQRRCGKSTASSRGRSDLARSQIGAFVLGKSRALTDGGSISRNLKNSKKLVRGATGGYFLSHKRLSHQRNRRKSFP
eukprot:scaffold26377_cov45-Phaeocystis_antarctica.AAC.7